MFCAPKIKLFLETKKHKENEDYSIWLVFFQLIPVYPLTQNTIKLADMSRFRIFLGF